ncbi:MAG: M23 family metallopeptidase [Dehalococcoidia bacterium]
MTRQSLLFLLVLCAAVALVLAASVPRPAHSTLVPGEFWRLPWRADSSHSVSGNGYGEDTHASGADRYALDFGVQEGQYVMATQEGDILTAPVADVSSCGLLGGYGNYVDFTDINGFVHRYAHLQTVFVTLRQHVLPGWAIGRAGHTGHVEPCDGTGRGSAPPFSDNTA